MKNSDMPAMPNKTGSVFEYVPSDIPGHEDCVYLEATGLTKREYFAAKAMEALIVSGTDSSKVPACAVRMADYLLEELEGDNESE